MKNVNLVFMIIFMVLFSCTTNDPTNDYLVNEEPEKFNKNVRSYIPASEANYFRLNTNYYTKYAIVGDSNINIPIVAGSRVSNEAILKAQTLLNALVRTYPNYAVYSLRANRIYIAIFANDEYPNVLPGWPSSLDAKRYAGGFGPTTTFPVCGIHEGDILKNRFDRYPRENVVLHEFQHAIKNFALEKDIFNFKQQIQNLYSQSINSGKWRNTYAATNAEEYWAECVQSYFNVNTEGPGNGDGVHNNINTAQELFTYDFPIYDLIYRTYNGASLPRGDW